MVQAEEAEKILSHISSIYMYNIVEVGGSFLSWVAKDIIEGNGHVKVSKHFWGDSWS